jgi:hypothetical protein
LVPATDRVVVEVENLGDRHAAHAVVEQQQGIGSPRQTCLRLAIAHQRDEVLPHARIEKAAANHVGDKNPLRPPWQAHFSPNHRIQVYRRA